MRCFIITRMKCQLGGGGGGVAYRLLSANQKYRLLDDAVFIFGDQIIKSPSGERMSVNTEGDPAVVFEKLDGLLSFSENDIYVFHDLESFYTLKMGSEKIVRTIMVYHGQGAPYYEYRAFGNPVDDEVRLTCAMMAYLAIAESTYFAFPSKGAERAFLDTAPELKEFTDNRTFEVLYNGCTPAEIAGDCVYDELINDKTDDNTTVFITVAALNEAKAVECLPAFFLDYLNYNTNFLWILIGDGAKRDELEKNLDGLSDHVIWIKDKVPNPQVLHMMRRSDYYIIAQRFSIFDFSTIEAMHMECVPVLSPVGGNLEVIVDDNGYLLDESLDALKFHEWEQAADLSGLKHKNHQIAEDLFSEKAMLERYRDLIIKTGQMEKEKGKV